jgi:hypothetical protein
MGSLHNTVGACKGAGLLCAHDGSAGTNPSTWSSTLLNMRTPRDVTPAAACPQEYCKNGSVFDIIRRAETEMKGAPQAQHAVSTVRGPWNQLVSGSVLVTKYFAKDQPRRMCCTKAVMSLGGWRW